MRDDLLARAGLAWRCAGGLRFSQRRLQQRQRCFHSSRRQRRARYVLRIPVRAQPYVNRAAESAWYRGLPESVGVRPIAWMYARRNGYRMGGR